MSQVVQAEGSLVDNLLSVDQMASLLNRIEGRPEVAIPRVEPLVSELLALVNSDNACKPVDLGTNPAVNHHVAEFVLSALNRDANELAHAGEADAAVVLLDHSQIVLHELSNQLDKVVLRVQGTLLEGLESAHLLCDVVLLEGHQLEGQELAHILREQLVLLEFTGVHGLNHVEEVDLFLVVA